MFTLKPIETTTTKFIENSFTQTTIKVEKKTKRLFIAGKPQVENLIDF